MGLQRACCGLAQLFGERSICARAHIAAGQLCRCGGPREALEATEISPAEFGPESASAAKLFLNPARELARVGETVTNPAAGQLHLVVAAGIARAFRVHTQSKIKHS